MWPSEIFRISSYICQECLVKISDLWEWWNMPAQSHLDQDDFTCKNSENTLCSGCSQRPFLMVSEVLLLNQTQNLYKY